MLNVVALEASWVTFGDHVGLILGCFLGLRQWVGGLASAGLSDPRVAEVGAKRFAESTRGCHWRPNGYLEAP
mgnify:CR=1 FL=1